MAIYRLISTTTRTKNPFKVLISLLLTSFLSPSDPPSVVQTHAACTHMPGRGDDRRASEELTAEVRGEGGGV